MQSTTAGKNRVSITAGILSFTALLITASTTALALQPGDLDPTFGKGGKVIDQPGIIHSVALQQDDKIVTLGEWGNSMVIARYNPNGSPDITFGSNGKVVTGISDYFINSNASIAVQSDGKIVVAQGFDYDTDGNESDVVVRYNPNGSLDNTFGATGIVNLPWNIAFFALAVQPDGKIVVVGAGFTVVRYNQNGSFDTTFDGDGIVITNLGGNYDSAYAVAIQPDGKLVAAGRGLGGNSSSFYEFAVVRYNSDGSPDSTFGGDGIVTTGFGSCNQAFSQAFSASLQWDGKIVAAGYSYNNSTYDWALVRYNPDGSLDDTFDSDGKVITPVPSTYYTGNQSVAIQKVGGITLENLGRIVVSGTSFNGTTYHDFTLVRYNSNGSLDSTFGGGDGMAAVDFNNSSDVANGMVLDSRGHAVVVGESDGAFALARFLLLVPRSTPPFKGDGKGAETQQLNKLF